MHVLVVGGAGYIGSVTVDLLVDRGHSVTVLDNLSSGHAEAINDDAELVTADVRDEEALSKTFAGHNFDAVINYSGYIQAGESVNQPGRYFANNIGGAIGLLNCMVTYEVMRYVFSSSAAVYGEPQVIPIPEDHPMIPVNPYGETKAAIERLLPWYEQAHGMRHVSLRYFNASGATNLRGEDHRPETHLIPIVLSVALGHRDKLTLFGRDYPTRDGTCVRDYIHVTDLADAHVLALDQTATTSGSYNLGNGLGFTNLEVIDAARRVTEHDILFDDGQRRDGDPAELVASSEKAQRELGWSPRHRDLESIIDSAWRWHNTHSRGYNG